MTKCSYCEEEIEDIPFKCKLCGGMFCSEHRLPEDHNCRVLARKKSKNKEKWRRVLKNSKNKYQKRKTKYHKKGYEMYIPRRKKHSLSPHHHKNFSSKNFLSKYIYPRIQRDVKPPLMQFLFIFLIGLVLNYVYYQNFSLTYLFIGGVNEWFNVLMPTLNYGINMGYDLFYLILNGIYYTYFYYSFILVIYYTITNLEKRDTWVMLGWFVIFLWILIKLFPQII